MKKVFLAVACIAFVASMASCKKDCTCTTKGPGIPDASVTSTGVSKKDCEAASVTVGEMKTTCVSA
ncbi:MAG: hypothetical protein LBV02_04470 [Bacteroidales bacterium]|nr:hypothetical protein [Bacteroidales bacterium]